MNVRFNIESQHVVFKKVHSSGILRLPSPIVWGRISSGFRIENLLPHRYNEVIELIKEDYIHLDPLCTSVDINSDTVSTKNLVKQSRLMMRDGSSLVVLDESNEDKLAGVLLLCVVNKIDFGRAFSRVKIDHGNAYNKIAALKTQLLKSVDVYEKYQCDSVLRYYLLAIKPSYRGKRLGYNLLRCGFDVAGLLRIPIAMGVFSMGDSQKIARQLGFEVEMEIGYCSNGTFRGNSVRDTSCALMIAHVPRPKISEPPPPPVEVKVDKKGKGDKKKK